jgi:hypothetical protein
MQTSAINGLLNSAACTAAFALHKSEREGTIMM